MGALRADDRAPGLFVGERVDVAPDASLGAHVVLHDRVTIGPGCAVQDAAVLGLQPPRLPGADGADEWGAVVLEAGAAVCAHAVVYAGVHVGAGAIVGDQSLLREGAEVGRDTVVGRGSTLSRGVRVGDRVRIQTNVWLAAGTVVEDDAFLGPGVTAAGDEPRGATLGRACRIGGGAVIVGAVEVGEEAFVAAGAVVEADVPARTVVMGSPARVVRAVGEEELLERWR
jgi:acetyltransferase-like isoleucine patch superfamily enzyme